MSGIRRLVILGAGALGREIAEAVRAVNAVRPQWELVGFLDDAAGSDQLGLEAGLDAPVLGTFAEAKGFTDEQFVLAVANPRAPRLRAEVAARLDIDDDRYATVVHPAASIAASTRIGAGSVLLAGVVTTADVEIGRHVLAMPNTVFTHDNRIGDFTSFGAGVLVAGRTTIGAQAYVGAGAKIRENLTVGTGALVGMGSVVTTDIPDDEVWAGVPARPFTVRRPAGVFVHPLGLCESDDVGAGTRVWAFAHVLPGAVVGERCNICDHAFVEGGARLGNNVTVKNGVLVFDRVTIEDDVFLGPGVVFTNDMRPRAANKRSHDELDATLVRTGVTLGAGVVVVCGSTIGEHAFVAAGATVIADVPAHALMVGNPARAIGWVCECGERLDGDLRCTCARAYVQGNLTEGLRPR
jgi:UDP-2-acetamido-3-amino-2,3-dideoxy-glucuronate N-acetyltransferase